MRASSPVLPTPNVVDHRMGEEMKEEEPASDANTIVEKHENEDENEPGHAMDPEEELAPDEYPHGLQFLFILLALILSVFMVALDLVCLAPVFRQPYADSACRPSSQRLFQRSRMTSTALTR